MLLKFSYHISSLKLYEKKISKAQHPTLKIKRKEAQTQIETRTVN